MHDRERGEGGDSCLARNHDEKGIAEHEGEQERQRPRACRDGGQKIVEHVSEYQSEVNGPETAPGGNDRGCGR